MRRQNYKKLKIYPFTSLSYSYTQRELATLRSALPLGVLAIPLSGNAPLHSVEEPPPSRFNASSPPNIRIIWQARYIDTFRFSLPTSVNNNKQDFSFSCQRHSTAGMLGIYKIPVSPGQVAHLPVLQHQRTGSQHSAFFQSTCLFILLAPGNQFQPAFLYEYSSIGHCCQNPGRGSIYHHPRPYADSRRNFRLSYQNRSH